MACLGVDCSAMRAGAGNIANLCQRVEIEDADVAGRSGARNIEIAAIGVGGHIIESAIAIRRVGSSAPCRGRCPARGPGPRMGSAATSVATASVFKVHRGLLLRNCCGGTGTERPHRPDRERMLQFFRNRGYTPSLGAGRGSCKNSLKHRMQQTPIIHGEDRSLAFLEKQTRAVCRSCVFACLFLRTTGAPRSFRQNFRMPWATGK